MLTSDCLVPLTDTERPLFLEVVPEDHPLRRILQHIDFEEFRPSLETAYKGFGRPPLDCVFVLKLELLARQYRLSDREVIAAARFNIAHRLFLGISLKSPLPHHTLLTYFRQRLGAARLQAVFDTLVGQARRLGLVKDRLRLKDATHIIANIAVPSTIRLVAEVRDQIARRVAAIRRDTGSRGRTTGPEHSSRQRGRQGRRAPRAARGALAGRAGVGRRCAWPRRLCPSKRQASGATARSARTGPQGVGRPRRRGQRQGD